MCHLNKKVNHIHEKAQDFQSIFSALKFSSFTIHQVHLQLLSLEIIKLKPNIMNKICEFLEDFPYELRCGNCLTRSDTHSAHFGIESTANIAAKK